MFFLLLSKLVFKVFRVFIYVCIGLYKTLLWVRLCKAEAGGRKMLSTESEKAIKLQMCD